MKSDSRAVKSRTNKLSHKNLTRVRNYIQSVEWRFAKTMPQWPHFYTIFDWNPDKRVDFYYFAYLIQKYGSIDPWGKNEWSYLIVDNYKYWVIGDVLNRGEPKSNCAVLKDGEKYRALAKE